MLKGYNLAFMPINYSKKFVQFAHDTAKGVKVGDYLLGPISLPHVSICHFIMDDVDIENIWHQAQEFPHFQERPFLAPIELNLQEKMLTYRCMLRFFLTNLIQYALKTDLLPRFKI